MTLDELNAAPSATVVATLGGVFEDAPWVAERAAAARPFATVTALHTAMLAAVLSAPDDVQLAFLCAHPELGGATARSGAMGAESTAEQRGLGLDRLAADRAAVIEQMNAEYRTRFGFPFILCVRRHTRASVMEQFRRRLANDPALERQQALAEIARITALRLVALVDGPAPPTTTGWLSTHVLDTAAGRPAAGVPVALFELDGDAAVPLAEAVTNADGRTDAPLLAGGPLRIGCYELRFTVSGYFAADGPGFLDVIPVRFGITEAEVHYHVPLLVSPGAYSTYRGS